MPDVDRRTFLLATLALVLGGCAGAAEGPPQPPAVRYGRDNCAECGMTISDERFAGAYVLAGGNVSLFDDIGDLVTRLQKTGAKPVALFVHDYDNRQWIKAETATYVRSGQLQTPMAWGLVAFAAADRAQAFAAGVSGQVHTWTGLTAQPLTR